MALPDRVMPAANQAVTILVVDDDPGLARLMVRALRRDGYETAVAGSGLEATAWLHKNQADLLLLDLKLPDAEGPELLKAMKDAGHSVPFVIITGQGDERVAVDMMKSGALDYLVKDVNFIEFIPTVVRRALEQVERTRRLDAAEEALRRQAGLLDLSHDAIIVWNDRGGIEFWNTGAAKLYGYDANEVQRHTAQDLLQTRYPCPWPDVETALRKDGTWEGEVRQVTKAGGEVAVSSRLQVMPGSDGKTIVLATNRDITDHHRLQEELLRATEQEQQRIGRDLHDGLGQELTAISMLNNVVQKRLQSKALPEAATAARLAELLRNATRHVRLISHGLQPVAAEPGGLMSGLRMLVTEATFAQGVQGVFLCPEPVEVHDTESSNHFYRIAQEAVQNALRHGNPKQVTVRLMCQEKRLVLEVQDDGAGIASRSDKTGGMGLSTMRYRADAMNGFLEVSVPPEGGTLVRCSAPCSQMVPEKQ